MSVERQELGIAGQFIVGDLYKYPSGERRLDVVYLEPGDKRTVLLTRTYPSHDEFYRVYVDENLTVELGKQARALAPGAAFRERQNLDEMQELSFKPQDVACDCGGIRPGEPCADCDQGDARQETLNRFLIWLAEKIRKQPRLTKKLIIEIAQMQGYDTSQNLYYRGTGVVLSNWASGTNWVLYVGGKMDPTKSIWMTSGRDLSDPEHGPFTDAKGIALAAQAVSRGGFP